MTVLPYSGFNFWFILLIFVLIHLAVRFIRAASWIRNLYMIAVSTSIIALAQGGQESLPLLLLLLSIAGMVYLAGRVVLSSSSKKLINRLNAGFIVLVVFVLGYFKYSYFQITVEAFFEKTLSYFSNLSFGLEKHIFLLGVSYFSFKFIHFLVECYKRQIENLNFLTFLNYTLFFPSFFGGPINRYNFFSANIEGKTGDSIDYTEGIKRIINGLFKKIVLANSLLPFSIASMDFSDPALSAQSAIIGVYAYMFYIYFDFSGYTDMAIGSAKLVGIDLPENFNYPFFKRNLQQFWANWHMSLTTWLTDYVYWPLVRKFRNARNLKKRPVTLSNICIVTTFMVCGIWHGDGMNFFLWGVYHGIGLAILNMFTFIERKYFSMKVKKFINKTRYGHVLSNLVTFQYVAFGFLLFGSDMEQIKIFFERYIY